MNRIASNLILILVIVALTTLQLRSRTDISATPTPPFTWETTLYGWPYVYKAGRARVDSQLRVIHAPDIQFSWMACLISVGICTISSVLIFASLIWPLRQKRTNFGVGRIFLALLSVSITLVYFQMKTDIFLPFFRVASLDQYPAWREIGHGGYPIWLIVLASPLICLSTISVLILFNKSIESLKSKINRRITMR